MPIHTEIDQTRKIIFTDCKDTLTLQDFTDYQDEVWTNPEVYDFNEQFDISAADLSELKFNDILEIARRASRLGPPEPANRIAFLVRSIGQKSILNLYRTIKRTLPVKSREMRVFYEAEKEQAHKWLMNEESCQNPAEQET